jgi:hypothetical protein
VSTQGSGGCNRGIAVPASASFKHWARCVYNSPRYSSGQYLILRVPRLKMTVRGNGVPRHVLLFYWRQ